MGKVAGWFKSKNDRIRRQALNNSFAKKYELLTVNETETAEAQAVCLQKQGDALLKLHEGQKELRDGQKAIITRQDELEAEFRNNDGHSMRDSNDRTEAIARQVAHFLGLEVPEAGAPVVDHQSPESSHH